mmetsp:Transcript_68490/g.155199  ORF Transcript_68490/g.155199 Transcript_68490/m.155199 type:complete len:327 (+) Transcript_68490:146-1126(+)
MCRAWSSAASGGRWACSPGNASRSSIPSAWWCRLHRPCRCVHGADVADKLAADAQAQLIPRVHLAQFLFAAPPLRAGIEEGLDHSVHRVVLHDRIDGAAADGALILAPHPVGAACHAEVVRAGCQRHALVNNLHADRAVHQLVEVQAADLFRRRQALCRVPEEERYHLIRADPVCRENADLVTGPELPGVTLAHDAPVDRRAVGGAVSHKALVDEFAAIVGLRSGARLAALTLCHDLKVQERSSRVLQMHATVLVPAHCQHRLILRCEAERQQLGPTHLRARGRLGVERCQGEEWALLSLLVRAVVIGSRVDHQGCVESRPCQTGI